MDFRSVAVGSIYTILSRLVVLFCGFLVTIALARQLGPVTFGMYSLILSILVWVEHTVSMGIPSVYRKILSENRDATPAVLSYIFSVSAPYCLSVMGIFAMLSPFIARGLHDDRLFELLILSSIDIPLFGLYTTYMAILNGRGHFGAQSILACLYSVSRTVLIVGAVILGFGVIGALIGNALGSFFGFLLAMYLTRRHVAKDKLETPVASTPVDYQLKRRVYSYGIPYLVTFLVASVFIHMDMWLVKALTPNTETTNAVVGYYAVAYNISRIPFFLIGAITFTVFPAVSKAAFEGRRRDARKQISQSLTMVLVVVLPMIAVIVSTAELAIDFLFSTAYVQAADAFRILFTAVSAFSIFLFFLTIIAAENRQRISLLITVPLLPVAIALHTVMIPAYGIEGAAAATGILSILGVLISGGYVWLRFGSFLSLGTHARLLFANACFYAVSTFEWLYQYHLLLGYLVLIVVYALLLLVLRIVNVEEIVGIVRSQLAPSKVTAGTCKR